MVRTGTRDSEERELNEFELHHRQYGKRLAALLSLGIGMAVLAAVLSLFIGGTSEVAEDAGDATGDAGDAPSDATGDADAVNDAAGNATKAAGELGSNLAQITKDAEEDATNSASNTADRVTNTQEDAVNSAGEVGSNVGEETQDAASSGNADEEAVNSAGEVGSNVVEGTQDVASSDNAEEEAVNSAGEVGSNVGEETQDVASSGNGEEEAVNSAGEVGSNVVEGTQDVAANTVSDAAISKAVNSLRSGEWGVNQVIALQPDNPILFDYSSAELSMQDKQTISELAQQIKQLDSEQVAVKLVGHASKTGNPQSNLVLSQYRADVVAEELRNLGVDKTINTEGKGYTEPTNSIPANDARQQRTEVQLVRVK